MAKVFPGRYTAGLDGDFVVFIIGMRINRPHKVKQWWPVLRAMGPMLRELGERPELGLLGSRAIFMGSSPAFLQHWRSFEDLERFARNPDEPHLPAWRAFNQAVRATGDVGIWHETYRVRAGEYEALYGNMPRWGMAEAGEHRPVGSTNGTAAERLNLREADEPPVAPY